MFKQKFANTPSTSSLHTPVANSAVVLGRPIFLVVLAGNFRVRVVARIVQADPGHGGFKFWIDVKVVQNILLEGAVWDDDLRLWEAGGIHGLAELLGPVCRAPLHAEKAPKTRDAETNMWSLEKRRVIHMSGANNSTHRPLIPVANVVDRPDIILPSAVQPRDVVVNALVAVVTGLVADPVRHGPEGCRLAGKKRGRPDCEAQLKLCRGRGDGEVEELSLHQESA